jgi:threonine synthase
LLVQYVSTRDGRPRPERVEFEDVLLRGLAPDGGLYLPDQWPSLSRDDWRRLRGRPYAEIAARIISPFLGNAFSAARLSQILADTYAGFDDPQVAPLRELSPGLWLLELFHGPTLAFKDYALQLVGRLFDEVLARRGGRVTIIGATSGDTGSAAIEACRDRATADIFVLYPEGRISAVQRRQMTTVPAVNVHAIGVAGSFDDCQDLVKAMFADAPFRAAHNLSAVNSINWARIMAQTVYYAVAALALGAPDTPVSFTVPTGNFGNVYAAHVARKMGLPIGDLVIATNRNDILARFFNGGAMALQAVEPSLSPSMDIQISSNFERLFYELRRRDGRAVAEAMTRFRSSGTLPVTATELAEARALFTAYAFDDDATVAEVARTWRESDTMLDPHSAVGVAAARAHRGKGGNAETPMVALATAHPAKFPDAIERAIGLRPELPPRLADLMTRPERLVTLPNELKAVEDYVRGHARPLHGVAA